MVISIVTLLCGAYLILMSLMSHTSNVRSCLFYRFLPFAIGVWLLLISLTWLGVTHLPLPELNNNQTKVEQIETDVLP